MNTPNKINPIGTKNKAAAIGRLLVASNDLDTKRRQFKKLQNILGKKMYYNQGNKWFYNIKALKNKTIAELNKYADEIENCIN